MAKQNRPRKDHLTNRLKNLPESLTVWLGLCRTYKLSAVDVKMALEMRMSGAVLRQIVPRWQSRTAAKFPIAAFVRDQYEERLRKEPPKKAKAVEIQLLEAHQGRLVARRRKSVVSKSKWRRVQATLGLSDAEVQMAAELGIRPAEAIKRSEGAAACIRARYRVRYQRVLSHEMALQKGLNEDAYNPGEGALDRFWCRYAPEQAHLVEQRQMEEKRRQKDRLKRRRAKRRAAQPRVKSAA
jgi:hypothetical protein